jgi:small conductance mechanosensitive channel
MVTSGLINNLSGQGNRRVDMTFVVDEPNNVDRVKEVIQEAINTCPYVLKDPPPDIFLLEFNCDELRFAARPWCRSEHYWTVWAHVQEAVKLGFDKANLIGNVQYVQLIQERKDVR